MPLAKGLDEVADNYSRWLRAHHPGRVSTYDRLLKSSRTAALLEAVVFSTCGGVFGYEVDIAEVDGEGGPDFRCKRSDDAEPRLIVEATSLDGAAVSGRSGIPDRNTRGVVSFSYVTSALQAAAKRKASQVAGQPCPRVVVIGSTHAGADVLFDTHAAATLMFGESVIKLAVDAPTSEAVLESEFEDAVFFKLTDTGALTPLRRSISAIVLASVYDSGCYMCGLLHPDPAVRFAPELLPGVPFLKVKHWPPESGKVVAEWIVGHPHPVLVPLTTISDRSK